METSQPQNVQGPQGDQHTQPQPAQGTQPQSAQAHKPKDFYNILGVSQNATEEEIKEAYKKKTLKFHPKRYEEELRRAEENFKNVSEAYQVLTDKEKRKAFDESHVHKEKPHHGHYHIVAFDPYSLFFNNWRQGLWQPAELDFLDHNWDRDLYSFNTHFDRDEFFRPQNLEHREGLHKEGEPIKTDQKEGEQKKPEQKDDVPKSFYSVKSIKSHTVVENGKKKTITHRRFDENGQVREEKKEEEWDDKGNVHVRSLPLDEKKQIDDKKETDDKKH